MSARIYPDYHPRVEPSAASLPDDMMRIETVIHGGVDSNYYIIADPDWPPRGQEKTLDPKYTLLDRLRLAWFVFHLPYGLYNSLHMVQEARECLEAASDKDILDKDPGIDYLADADAELANAEQLLKDMMGYEKE